MNFDARIIEVLKNNGVGVLPTDTIYGVVGSALRKETVERIYKLRQRDPKKPMVIMIGSFEDLDLFNVKVDVGLKKTLKKFWPGKVSIILPCPYKKFSYLHRGFQSLAFRLPALKWLQELLKKTGPLVATSANLEGLAPAKTITEAKKYFGNKVDFYVDGGKLAGLPSTLIKIEKGQVVVLRKGAAKIKNSRSRTSPSRNLR